MAVSGRLALIMEMYGVYYASSNSGEIDYTLTSSSFVVWEVVMSAGCAESGKRKDAQ